MEENRQGCIPNESNAPRSESMLVSNPTAHPVPKTTREGGGNISRYIGSTIKEYEEGDEIQPQRRFRCTGRKGQFADTPPKQNAFSRKIEKNTKRNTPKRKPVEFFMYEGAVFKNIRFVSHNLGVNSSLKSF